MKFDLNKYLKLRIRGKLAIAFTALSIFPILILGSLAISTNIQTIRKVAIEDLTHDLLTIKERMRSFLNGIDDNTAVLTSSSAFREFIRSVDKGDSSAISVALERLQPEMISFAEHKNIFFQIKFIDYSGNELFNIEQKQGLYKALPPNKLNQTGTTFYLYVARKSIPNKPTFLPVELIRNEQRELSPGICYILPIYTTSFTGALIFQIYAQSFFKVIERKTPHSPVGKVMLVNSEGYFLYHSEKKKDWNHLLASKDSLNLKMEYGEDIASRLLSTSSSPFLDLDHEIVTHVPLFRENIGINSNYTILKSVSKAEVFASANSFKKVFYGLLGSFLLISLFFAYLATLEFTQPLEKLSRESAVIAAGDYHARVDVRTYDEIQELAKQFNTMAESLEQHDLEISRQHDDLEQTVRKRTRELRQEKNKLQAILDNVPSGFILLDKNFKILSASAALESITGKPVKSLIGLPCEEVIGNGHLCAGCPTDQVFRSGKMETQLVRQTSPDGDNWYFELVSIPLKKNGRIENILEIITDVTDRKRLQEQLVHSERLAATGEMAAVIAHEMRNSLTSVRMILQLLSETDSLPSSDRESLDVALDSLNRMEKVVKDLLQLARPAQLQKKPEKINEIIQDSIDFSGHQIRRKDIELKTRLTDKLPSLRLDREHFKEALINLILNASQASDAAGRIEIMTKMTTLKKTLRDLGQVQITTDSDLTVDVKEIVLAQGDPVVCIEIKDSGCGIPRENIERIFDPFFTTKISGTGLGLSFVKRVVNEHDGIILVKSKPNQGSRFSIILPVEKS